MSLTHKDVREILDLLDRSEHCDFVEFTVGDVTVRAGSETAVAAQGQPATPAAVATAPAQTASAPAATPASASTADAVVPDNMVAIRSPMGGAFYAAPSPEDPPFVTEGDMVAEGETLCLVEAMKLFNTIKAPVAGRVHKICVENGKPVALEEVMIIIEPEGA